MDGPTSVNARCRQLPAVDRLLELAQEGTDLSRWSLVAAVRAVLDAARRAILAGEPPETDPGVEILCSQVRGLAQRLEQVSPCRVVNATGVVLHTNLGRAPLAAGAARAVAEAAAGYSNLEFDLDTGERGSRLSHVSELLSLLSGAESALVVNNGAAALLLAVDVFAAHREVILSRGEMIEIGGSFRLPEILGSSRARMAEIGTTNRTHLRDYEAAIGPDTGMILKVHHSCFEMRGFTSEVSLAELAALAHDRGVPLVEDRGSGTFLDLRPHGIPEGPAWEGLDQGADLVLFSGDKLLGGPQAGIVIGRRDCLDRMRSSPLARALRVDKLTLAALNWTLRRLLEGNGPDTLPVLRMLLTPSEELQARAEHLVAVLSKQGLGKLSIESQGSVVGGGALPEFKLSGPVVRLKPDASAGELVRKLRQADPPVLVRVHKDALMIDPRTLGDGDLERLIAVLTSLEI
jgi:L-seryl-tRNA(Ser) seleniumtransferase